MGSSCMPCRQRSGGHRPTPRRDARRPNVASVGQPAPTSGCRGCMTLAQRHAGESPSRFPLRLARLPGADPGGFPTGRASSAKGWHIGWHVRHNLSSDSSDRWQLPGEAQQTRGPPSRRCGLRHVGRRQRVGGTGQAPSQDPRSGGSERAPASGPTLTASALANAGRPCSERLKMSGSVLLNAQHVAPLRRSHRHERRTCFPAEWRTGHCVPPDRPRAGTGSPSPRRG
jgi:hypothetical protein